MTKSVQFLFLSLVGISLSFPHVRAGIRAVTVKSSHGISTRIQDGDKLIFSSLSNNAAIIVTQPAGKTNVLYKKKTEENGILSLSIGEATGLQLSESWCSVTPELIERTVTVNATSDQRYFLDFGWKADQKGVFYSFLGEEVQSKKYTPSCSGPEFTYVEKEETVTNYGEGGVLLFPFLGCKENDNLYGIIGDTPGKWENRCFMEFKREDDILSLSNGDGSASRIITIPPKLDATTTYRTKFDGWQHIETGETQIWKTWIFTSKVKSTYDVQLAAHLALANAQGFNSSGLEAILRNTSYLLLRRNLLRPEGDFIFISGIEYGWKQWVTDAFYANIALDNEKFSNSAFASNFFDRLNYEDNSQYYLIWAVLVKRAGGVLDMRTIDRAYRFIRGHEKDGFYIPPRLNPNSKCYKTYQDQLPYEDDDAPSSDQGFHCGALMAARELGFQVRDEDIDKSIAAYQAIFNKDGGYMPTSLRQKEYVGQDGLYGEVLTYAVFGKKLLTDEMVKAHLETTMRIQTTYGMRVISKANGDLLDGHSGEYCFGGSWFFHDGPNYLDGLIHGMDAKWIDEQLLRRIRKEVAYNPAFNESISTLTGKPHGHILYVANSGYWWLRQEIRKHLGITGPDPVDELMDKELGIVHHDGYLVLDPSLATLRPK
jgi:hypothetical protein